MEGKNWSILFENKTVNENYFNSLSILNEACDKYIPTKTVVIRPDDKPFMNSSIRKAIRKKTRLPTTQIIGHNIDICEMT
jgi:hypothetical protein